MRPFPPYPSGSLRLAYLVVLTGLWLLGTGLACADVVILKDGHVLEGKVRREQEIHIDSSGQPFEIPKQFFLVDDQVRRVLFGSRQVEDVEPGNPNSEVDIVHLRRQVLNLANLPVPSPMQILSVAAWDLKWERTLRIRSPNATIAVAQRISVLNPYYLRADSLRYRWPIFYLTREYDADTIRTLLAEHPDLKRKGDAGDALKRLRVFRFLLQAGWLDEAEQELAALAQDLPEEKDKVEAARKQVRKLKTTELVKEIQQAHDGGRSQWVQAALTALPTQELEEKQQARLRTLRTEYTTARDRLARARRFLIELPPRIDETPKRELFTQAAAAILAEVTPETAMRLDAFVGLAEQAARERQQNRRPAHAPDQLLALAVSGWLLGNSVADTRVDTAIRLWKARQFVLNYLRTPSGIDRRLMLQTYQKDMPSGVDEITQMLRLLPPPEVYGDVAPGCGQWLTVTGTALALPVHGLASVAQLPLVASQGVQGVDRPVAHKFQADVPWSQRRGATYWVQLPLEYQPGRLYPVLVALHHTSEGAQDILKRLAPLAAARGYLLVAPAWMRGFRNTYDYSPEEHAAVTDVLWEVRRRFWVDADRVFLTGFGDGASMAFDVGLSHPHLFAGVLPMGGSPRYFAQKYKHNGQFLPFYVVEGDRNGTNPKAIRDQYSTWVPRGYPVLYVEYKGRALEWFAAEWPHAFDWMAKKKRAAAFPDLGAPSYDYTSMRATDNRFYWLSADGLVKRCENNASEWNPLVTGAALSARLGEGNALNVRMVGFKRGTVWLGPGMVDFEKPLTLRLNGAVAGAKRPIKPSLETLLEDLYQRGDRQRVYWAKVEI